MSFSMTTEAVRNRTKTVTRRFGWGDLKPGTLLWAVEKGMGLKKGEHVKKLGLIRVVSTRWEPLWPLLDRVDFDLEMRSEGLAGQVMTATDFFRLILHMPQATNEEAIEAVGHLCVNRIEFEYVEDAL